MFDVLGIFLTIFGSMLVCDIVSFKKLISNEIWYNIKKTETLNIGILFIYE